MKVLVDCDAQCIEGEVPLPPRLRLEEWRLQCQYEE